MSTAPLRPVLCAFYRIRLLCPPSTYRSRWPATLHSGTGHRSDVPVALLSPSVPARNVHSNKPSYEDLSGLPFSNLRSKQKPGPSKRPPATIKDDALLAPINDKIVFNEVTEYFWRCLGWDSTRFRGIRRYDFSRSLQHARCQLNLQELIYNIRLPVAYRPTAKILTMLFHYSKKDLLNGDAFFVQPIMDRGAVVASPTIRDVFTTLDRLTENERTRKRTPEQREKTGWEYGLEIPLNFEIVVYFITGLRGRPGNDDAIMTRKLVDVVDNWRAETLDKQRYTIEFARAMREYSIKKLERKEELDEKSRQQAEAARQLRYAKRQEKKRADAQQRGQQKGEF
ncbi:hypothetical protein TWF696_009526 [Orbilia brochopaga]|uniref:Uncharacterized protein n=1 Tax=Orbilia brochopaga TaxID=3140254 RepID=A0AAV9UEE2_9PEZI